MKGVKFGNYHSYNDFSLILTSKSIQQPTIKTAYVDIEGGSGRLDLTEYFGQINYSNRKLSFTFETKLRRQEYYDMFEELSNAIHGRKLAIYLDEDEYFYFEGRVNVHEYKSSEKIGKVVIDVDCEPYKLEQYETNYQFNVSNSEIEGVLVNLRMGVTPQIEVVSSGSVTIKFNDLTYVLTNGIYTLPEVVLQEGNNIVKMSGNGQIRFKYRRGKL